MNCQRPIFFLIQLTSRPPLGKDLVPEQALQIQEDHEAGGCASPQPAAMFPAPLPPGIQLSRGAARPWWCPNTLARWRHCQAAARQSEQLFPGRWTPDRKQFRHAPRLSGISDSPGSRRAAASSPSGDADTHAPRVVAAEPSPPPAAPPAASPPSHGTPSSQRWPPPTGRCGWRSSLLVRPGRCRRHPNFRSCAFAWRSACAPTRALRV